MLGAGPRVNMLKYGMSCSPANRLYVTCDELFRASQDGLGNHSKVNYFSLSDAEQEKCEASFS